MIEEKQRIHRCAGRDREAEETEKNSFPDLHFPDSIAAWPGCLVWDTIRYASGRRKMWDRKEAEIGVMEGSGLRRNYWFVEGIP